MKNIIYITVLFLTCALVSCDDKDGGDPYTPHPLIITGPTSVNPETSATYLLAPYANPETYKWSVEGPAQIDGVSTGAKVKVNFGAVGDVKITVTNGSDTRIVAVTVKKISPVVVASLNGTGVLKNGVADTVFLTFPSALDAASPIPEIKLLTDVDSSKFHKTLAFNSGSIGPIVKIDGKHFYAIYTAGSGNGTPEALLTGMKSSSDYGSDVVDSAYVQLYKVDNIAPIADITYSVPTGSSGSEVTITATFNEDIDLADPSDSVFHILLSGAGVTAVNDTLVVSEDNPRIYTYTYKLTGNGDGPLSVSVANAVDLAHNDVATITHSNSFMVDNTNPMVTGLATDGGDFVSLEITSNEAGTAYYLVLDHTDAAPADVDGFFDADGVLSGSIQVTANDQDVIAKILATGSYDVYFLSMDNAGNYSTISSVPLTMN